MRGCPRLETGVGEDMSWEAPQRAVTWGRSAIGVCGDWVF